MVAEPAVIEATANLGCSLAKISMVAELWYRVCYCCLCCSLAKISMVAEQEHCFTIFSKGCSLAKISMVAERCSLSRI